MNRRWGAIATDAGEGLAGPYPGLRPFLASEADIFFGREQMADEVLVRLGERHMVVVHGASGCGKSSLVAAGVLPQLARRRARRGLTLRVGSFRPGSRPMQSMVTTIAHLVAGGASPDQVQSVYRAIAQRQGARAELARLAKAEGIDQLCIVVDQFEELFRYAEDESFEEAQRFADVLVGLAGASDRPANWWEKEEDEPAEPRGAEAEISFLLTMRSEFLGDCSRYPGLAEAINRTQYLLPNMERSDLIRAIREPADVFGGTVEHDLAERIADDAAREQDSLPLVQHALMKLWRASEAGSLTIADYEAAIAGSGQSEALKQRSTLGAILAGHAEAVLGEAAAGDPERIAAAGYIFRALTRKDSEGRAIRCPQRFRRLEQVSGVSPEMTREIVDSFRSEGVSFLTPYQAMDPEIDAQTVVDISHEALIRTWPRMSERAIDPTDAQPIGWVEREAQEAMLWRWVVLHAEFFKDNSSAYLDGTTTDRIGTWFETLKRRPEWVRPYLLHAEGREDVREEPEWKAVERLLEESRRRTWIERAMVRRWKKLGRWSLVLLVLALAGLVWGTMKWLEHREEEGAHLAIEGARQTIANSLYVTANVAFEKNRKRVPGSDPAHDEPVEPAVARAASGGGHGWMLVLNAKQAFLWGGAARPDGRIANLVDASGRPVTAADFDPEREYRVRGDFVLRNARPDAGGMPGEAIGLIVRDTVIRPFGTPVIAGSGAGSYWIPINLMPQPPVRVRLLHVGGTGSHQVVKENLFRLGYRIEARAEPSASGRAEVVYCGSGQRDAALRLAVAASRELAQTHGLEARTVAPVPGSDCPRGGDPPLRLMIDFSPAGAAARSP